MSNKLTKITAKVARPLMVVLATITLLSLISCDWQRPQTKKEYLQSFHALIEYTNHHCGSIEENKLQTMDAIFELFSQDLYEQFLPELSQDDRLLIWKYRAQYLKCKTKRRLQDGGRKLYRKIEEELLH